MGTNRRKKRNFAAEMETELITLTSGMLHPKRHAIGRGALLLCRGGMATVRINFGHWTLKAGSFIIFYPGDIVSWSRDDGEFRADVLCYSSEVLRQVSMNIEHEVYRELRDNRLINSPELINEVAKSLFSIFRFYFNDRYTPSIDRIVALQVQSFFIGFADYMRNNPDSPAGQPGGQTDSQRNQQLFGRFMQLMETHYRRSHEVSYYAQLMNISTKYLARVCREHVGLPPKQVIDEYLHQQLKLALRGTSRSLKEIAGEFSFSDQSALTRYFKSHEGKTPKQYREEA